MEAPFEHCIFAIILSSELSSAQAEQNRESLEENGGVVQVLDNGSIDLNVVTHIISATSDFPEYTEAFRQMIPVVKPGWITASLAKGKQAIVRPFTPDPNLMFSDVTLSCDDIPAGDKDAIIGSVLAMGGMESNPLSKAVTHICALTLEGTKCQKALEKGLDCKIVLPHWFDDCLRLGKRIDETPYLLPYPAIFAEDPEAPLPLASSQQIKGASTPRPDNLPLATDSPVRPVTVFRNKKVMLSEDLELSNRTKKVIEDLISSGGGQMTTSVHNADMYVGHWREGREYVFASRAGIDVGNLSWLYHLIVHNQWTSPLRRLMHYPLPKQPLRGFENLMITLSNYGGDSRTYLENLVRAAGAQFTKSMKPENTHLITARKTSDKCAAAEEWNIEMINHLWIEESYARCEAQRLSDPKYTHFPPRTNLGEIIGQTELVYDVLERLYFPKDPTPSPSDPMPLRRPIMREKDKNTNIQKSSGSTTAVEQDDEVGPVEVKKTVPRKRSRSVVAQVTTPAARRISAGKENTTPSTGSRSAKAQAVSRLNSLAPDIALYELEKKRKGSVWGGERAANKVDKERKRHSSPLGNREDEEEFSSNDEGEENLPKRKRQRSGLPPAEMRLLVTGFQGWVGNRPKEEADKKKMRALGILVTTDASNCTHLVAPQLIRTKKFLCALASGPTIISTDFIETCVKTGQLPKVENFILIDPIKEKEYGVKIKEIVARAKANKHSLLRRVPVYVTKYVANGDPETFQAIIEANGGTSGLYTGRPTIKKVNPEDDEGPPEPVYLISGLGRDEKILWPKFMEMAKDGNMEPRIVDADWLLDVALSQQQRWDDRYLLDPN